MLAFFIATPLPDPDGARSPTHRERRGRKGRWGSTVSRFGNGGGAGVAGGASNASRSPRLNSDYSGGEEESALEASAASSSTSSLADAASFVYRYGKRGPYLFFAPSEQSKARTGWSLPPRPCRAFG